MEHSPRVEADASLSSGLSPALQAQLKTLSFLKVYSKAAARACSAAWGQANGGVLRNAVAKVEVPFVRLLIAPYLYIVLVRDVYTQVYQWIENQMAVLRKRVYSASIYLTIYGQPGIGKSSTIPFLMATWWEQRRPLFYHVLGSAIVTLFDGPKSYEMSTEDFSGLMFEDPVLCLVETPKVPSTPLPLGHMIDLWHVPNVLLVIASSPASAPIQTLRKSLGEPYYWTLPCAGKEEIENVVFLNERIELAPNRYEYVGRELELERIQLNGRAPSDARSGGAPFDADALDLTEPTPYDLSEPLEQVPGADHNDSVVVSLGHELFRFDKGEYFEPVEIYHLLGPSFRIALMFPVEKGEKAQSHLEKVVTYTPSDAGLAIEQSKQPSGYHQLVVEVPKDAQPSRHAPSTQRVIPTKYLFAVLRGRAVALADKELERLVQLLYPLPQAQDFLYEALAFRYLESREIPLDVFPPTNAAAIPPMPNGLKLLNWDSEKDVPYCDAMYTTPPNFPSVDGFLITRTSTAQPILYLVQVTTAKQHPIKPEGTDAICGKLRWPKEPRIVFVFVSPSDDTGRRLVQPPRPTLHARPIFVGAKPGRGLRSGRQVQMSTKDCPIERAYAVVEKPAVRPWLRKFLPRPQGTELLR